MNLEVFNYSDYKAFLRAKIAGRRGLLTQIAKAAGCGQSFLSQVVNGSPELTPDQAFAVAEFFQMRPESLEYFGLLVQHSRAASPKLRHHLASKIKALKAEHQSVSKSVAATNDTEVSASDRDFYYSSWSVGAIHILTACKDYQTATKIAARLSIPVSEVNNTLEWLSKRALVRWNDGRAVHTGKNVHLPTAAIHNRINHLNWRLRGLQSSEDPASVHYTSVFAVSTGDIEEIRKKLLHYLENQRREIGQSGSDEALVFCCDLFRP